MNVLIGCVVLPSQNRMALASCAMHPTCLMRDGKRRLGMRLSKSTQQRVGAKHMQLRSNLVIEEVKFCQKLRGLVHLCGNS